ncbi:hypothetical protein EYF80_023626 [Liparis tanakae]|uniref:Uncharacterized protein n=1 Tax=Liparis tanakae TaxID=230148 RepID=A0A4Z2HK08_9TELE|nr:hypothetical protein EYF80_023626 [Liparis tanakae]
MYSGWLAWGWEESGEESGGLLLFVSLSLLEEFLLKGLLLLQLVNKLPDHLFGWSIQHREHIHDQSVNIPVAMETQASLCSPVLEEVLQSLADGVLLLDGQQVFQLLSKGAALNPDTGRKNLCHPLQGAEHGGAGALSGNAAPRQLLLCQDRPCLLGFLQNRTRKAFGVILTTATAEVAAARVTEAPPFDPAHQALGNHLVKTLPISTSSSTLDVAAKRCMQRREERASRDVSHTQNVPLGPPGHAEHAQTQRPTLSGFDHGGCRFVMLHRDAVDLHDVVPGLEAVATRRTAGHAVVHHQRAVSNDGEAKAAIRAGSDVDLRNMDAISLLFSSEFHSDQCWCAEVGHILALDVHHLVPGLQASQVGTTALHHGQDVAGPSATQPEAKRLGPVLIGGWEAESRRHSQSIKKELD